MKTKEAFIKWCILKEIRILTDQSSFDRSEMIDFAKYYNNEKTQQQQEIIDRLKSCIDKHINMLETPANENGKSIGEIYYSMKLEAKTILKELE